MKRIFALTVAVIISSTFFFACSTDDASVNSEPDQLVNTVSDDHNFNRKLADEDLAGIGADLKAGEQAQANVDITYAGELCPDVAASGNTANTGSRDSENYQYFSFEATAGNTVTIDVARVDCELDPAMSLYKGIALTNRGVTTTNGGVDMVYITRNDDRDDNQAPACGSFCGLDPQITYEITETGSYTVCVYRVGTCSGDDTAFEITVSGADEGDDCVQDSDGDGIPDDEDEYPDSDTTPIVTIDGCESGVDNLDLGDGAFMMDKINECAENAANHGGFVSCVTDLVNGWKQDGLIAANQKSKITNCASGANIP